MPHRRLFVVGALLAVFAALVTAGSSAAAATRGAVANVACGAVVTSDTVLAGNLTCSGDAVTVTGGAVLDLNGFTVRGKGTGRGISVFGNGTLLRNGAVVGFGVGVYVNATDSHIQDVAVKYNPTGGMLVDGFFGSTGTVIERTLIHANGYGIRSILRGGLHAQVLNNVITNNRGDGIRLFNQDDDGLYRGNLVARNSGNGMFVSDSTVKIINNVFLGNDLDGLRAEETAGPEFLPFWLVAGNQAFFNGGHGLDVITPGIPDGGNNFARGNALSPQCVNVAC